jgi:LysM repeat protein
MSANRKYTAKTNFKYHWSLKRFSQNFLLLLLICSIALILVTTAVKATFDTNPPQTVLIKVMRGDTLWSIARKLKPHTDPRLVIQKLKDHNQLVTSELKIGQCLEFPVKPIK